jgi:hypothetical protein
MVITVININDTNININNNNHSLFIIWTEIITQ